MHPQVQQQLWTDVTPRMADHSFSGVVFDLQCAELYEVTVHSLWLAGMLGTMRVFVRAPPHVGWCGGAEQLRSAALRCGWGNANDVIDASEWALIAQVGVPTSNRPPQPPTLLLMFLTSCRSICRPSSSLRGSSSLS
eukprot:SAG11_NODE_103_length_16571_cov_49.569208_13_plen_137_part_00